MNLTVTVFLPCFSFPSFIEVLIKVYKAILSGWIRNFICRKDFLTLAIGASVSLGDEKPTFELINME